MTVMGFARAVVEEDLRKSVLKRTKEAVVARGAALAKEKIKWWKPLLQKFIFLPVFLVIFSTCIDYTLDQLMRLSLQHTISTLLQGDFGASLTWMMVGPLDALVNWTMVGQIVMHLETWDVLIAGSIYSIFGSRSYRNCHIGYSSLHDRNCHIGYSSLHDGPCLPLQATSKQLGHTYK